MESNITKLQYEGKENILIGTAHVSKQSANLVKRVIEEEKPDCICVELDKERYQNIENPKEWESTDLIKVFKSKKVGFLIANLILSSYQKKIAKQLNTVVGQEMMQAIASTKETNATLVLADRNIRITFMRIWRTFGFWGKCKLIVGFLANNEETEISDKEIEKLLQEDIIENAMADMGKSFPVIREILVDERDQYLASKIKEAPGKKIVAVLGGAHVSGVKTEIFKEQDIEKIEKIPPKSLSSKLVLWILPVVIMGLIVYGFFVNAQTGTQQLVAWILWSGGMAALFTALSLGHPLSILAAFIAAPLSSLNPMLACGWFAGIVEANIKKPTVKDVNNIADDIFCFKGFIKNLPLSITYNTYWGFFHSPLI